MPTIFSKLTVMFQDPFWIALYERECDGCYEVSKITFGAEPKDYEVYEYMLRFWHTLSFSPPTEAHISENKRISPKRMQRKINEQLSDTGVGTKAQQAMKLMQEQNKLERKAVSKQQREEDKRRRLLLHQTKQKEKHKGH